MRETLVLNSTYMAVHIIDWQRTMTLMYKGQATAIDEYYNRYTFDEWKDLSQAITDSPNGFVQGFNFKIAVPEIIALTMYDELPSNEVKFTRKNLYKHYDFKCCYCGKRFKSEDINLDHVIPKSRGGKTEWDNIVLSCLACNFKKDRHTPQEAGMKMFYTPSKPEWRPAYALHLHTGINIKKSWQKFIDVCYWNVDLEKD